jgi:hypothetical protein
MSSGIPVGPQEAHLVRPPLEGWHASTDEGEQEVWRLYTPPSRAMIRFRMRAMSGPGPGREALQLSRSPGPPDSKGGRLTWSTSIPRFLALKKESCHFLQDSFPDSFGIRRSCGHRRRPPRTLLESSPASGSWSKRAAGTARCWARCPNTPHREWQTRTESSSCSPRCGAATNGNDLETIASSYSRAARSPSESARRTLPLHRAPTWAPSRR